MRFTLDQYRHIYKKNPPGYKKLVLTGILDRPYTELSYRWQKSGDGIVRIPVTFATNNTIRTDKNGFSIGALYSKIIFKFVSELITKILFEQLLKKKHLSGRASILIKQKPVLSLSSGTAKSTILKFLMTPTCATLMSVELVVSRKCRSHVPDVFITQLHVMSLCTHSGFSTCLHPSTEILT